jgi:hypothetical protein
VYTELFDKEAKVAQGILVNISESGARLITNVGLSRGRLMRLKLHTESEDLLETRATIVWSAQRVDFPFDVVGVRHGIRFVSSALGFVQTKKLLKHFRWSPRNKRSFVYALNDPDLEGFFPDLRSRPLDSYQDLCESLLPYTERLVKKLKSGHS